MTHVFKGRLRKGNDFSVHLKWCTFRCPLRNGFKCDRSFEPPVFPGSGRPFQRHFCFGNSFKCLRCLNHFRFFFRFRDRHSFSDRHILIRNFLLQRFFQESIIQIFEAGIFCRCGRLYLVPCRKALLIEKLRFVLFCRFWFRTAHINKAFQRNIRSQLVCGGCFFFRHRNRFRICPQTGFQGFCLLDIITICEPENNIVTDFQAFFFVPEFIIKSGQLIHPFLIYFFRAVNGQDLHQIVRRYPACFSDLIFQKKTVIIMRRHFAEVFIELDGIVQIIQSNGKLAQFISHLSSHWRLFVSHQKDFSGFLQLSFGRMRVRDHLQRTAVRQLADVDFIGIH